MHEEQNERALRVEEMNRELMDDNYRLKAELRNVKATLDGYRKTALVQERQINELEDALHRHHDQQIRKPSQIGCGYCGLELPVGSEG